MKTVVLSLGGSLIVPENIDTSFLKKFKEAIEKFIVENRIIIVCGGGKTCRIYQDAVDKIVKVTNDSKDWIGITATRLNAELVKQMFGEESYSETIIDPTLKVNTDKKIIVAAGWKPGFSSDMDAVCLAKQFNAKEVINVSKADYVYDKDPRKFPDAKKLEKLSWKEFFKIIGTEWKPGMNAPFDPIASKKAEEYGISVIVIGNDIKNIENCLNAKKFVGTTISR